jgi:hypothetical protein
MQRRTFLKLAGAGIAAVGLPRLAFAQQDILIGFSQALMNHPHRVAMAEVNRKYLEANFKD